MAYDSKCLDLAQYFLGVEGDDGDATVLDQETDRVDRIDRPEHIGAGRDVVNPHERQRRPQQPPGL